MVPLKEILAGGIMVSAWAIAVFFLRFWRKSHDRLFAYLASAFLLMGIERIAIIAIPNETHGLVYVIRLIAYLLIIMAIADKSRRGDKV